MGELLRGDHVRISVRCCPELDKKAFFIPYDRLNKVYDLVCRGFYRNAGNCILRVVEEGFEERKL